MAELTSAATARRRPEPGARSRRRPRRAMGLDERSLDRRARAIPEPAGCIASTPSAASGAGAGESATTRIPVVARPRGAGSSRRAGVRREIVVGGWRILLDVEDERTAAVARTRATRARGCRRTPDRWRSVRSSRAGSSRCRSREGDTVEAGQQLLVIEAMKMQNELRRRAPESSSGSRRASARPSSSATCCSSRRMATTGRPRPAGPDARRRAADPGAGPLARRRPAPRR